MPYIRIPVGLCLRGGKWIVPILSCLLLGLVLGRVGVVAVVVAVVLCLVGLDCCSSQVKNGKECNTSGYRDMVVERQEQSRLRSTLDKVKGNEWL